MTRQVEPADRRRRGHEEHVVYIHLPQTRLHVEVTGPEGAPCVLLIHSLATDLHLWDDLVSASDRWQFVRYDLRGHGRSDATPPPYELDDLVSDAIGVLDAVGADRAHVVGLSIGAMIGMGLAIDHPDRVAQLVLADGRADAPAAYADMWEGAIATVERGDLDVVIANSVERWFAPATRRDRPDLVDATREVGSRTSVPGFIGCARALQRLAYLDRLDRIGAPTLFIAGELDPVAGPEVTAAMAANVASAQVEVIAGAAHLTPLEAPVEFGRLVTEFLGRAARDATPLARQGARR